MKKLFITFLILSSFTVAPFIAVINTVQVVQAASLTNVVAALSSSAVSTASTVTITFTPNTAITTGSIIEVSYDAAFTGGASLLDTSVTVAGTNITTSVESGFTAGYFKSTLTTSAAVTTPVTITITGLTTPATAGNYNFSITNDIGGTGATYDNGAGLAYVANENKITITAFVPSVIDLEIYTAGVDTLLNGAGANTCALGVLSINTISSCTYDIGTGTNNTAGLTVQFKADADLNDLSGNTINACGGTDCNADASVGVSAGSEEYGIQITDNGAGEYTAAGSYATADQPIPLTATTFATTSTTGNGTNVGQTAQRLNVTHRASVDTSTVVGSYDQVVTYTAFTN